MRNALHRLARIATYGALAGGASGLALWARFLAGRLDEWPFGTLGSLLGGAFLLLPGAWLLNVRFAMRAVADLPDTARTAAARGTRPVDAARTYLDVSGSWALLLQLVSPAFWAGTVLALGAVIVLTAAAMLASILG